MIPAEGGRGLAVDADLSLTIDGADVRVRGYGDLLVVDAPSLRVARSLLRGIAAAPAGPSALDRHPKSGLTVDVRVGGGSVARIEPGVRPGAVSRLLGVSPARISLAGAVLALLLSDGVDD
ncbi:hypothetical protein [Halegenticoccus soli]|uniref:hypothetical protein n=1 Tax=Halegenticoccus soli TaxID=1985678 RepID=UPI000C6E6C31|nr:hypothetical protein [Halegenticoccus soli]